MAASRPSDSRRASDPLSLSDTSVMVAIIRCAADEVEQLDWNESLHARRGQEWVWQPTRRRKNWDSGSHLIAILAPGARVLRSAGWDGPFD
jgi:hypothetical protein